MPGLQGEPRAQLSLASYNASPLLRLRPSDLLLYSARVIPGNDINVTKLMNRISALGPEIALGRNENLHCSGHAYKCCPQPSFSAMHSSSATK